MRDTTSDKITKIGMMILFGVGAILVSGRYKQALDSYLNSSKTHRWSSSPDPHSLEVFFFYHLFYWGGVLLLFMAFIKMIVLLKK